MTPRWSTRAAGCRTGRRSWLGPRRRWRRRPSWWRPARCPSGAPVDAFAQLARAASAPRAAGHRRHQRSRARGRAGRLADPGEAEPRRAARRHRRRRPVRGGPPALAGVRGGGGRDPRRGRDGAGRGGRRLARIADQVLRGNPTGAGDAASRLFARGLRRRVAPGPRCWPTPWRCRGPRCWRRTPAIRRADHLELAKRVVVDRVGVADDVCARTGDLVDAAVAAGRSRPGAQRDHARARRGHPARRRAGRAARHPAGE